MRHDETNPEAGMACARCLQPVAQDDGSLFIGDDGDVYCNDHYPDREPSDA